MNKIKLLTFFSFLLVVNIVNAIRFTVDGIRYNTIDSNEVEVTTVDGNGVVLYIGDIYIPSTVSYGTNSYKVTKILVN